MSWLNFASPRPLVKVVHPSWPRSRSSVSQLLASSLSTTKLSVRLFARLTASVSLSHLTSASRRLAPSVNVSLQPKLLARLSAPKRRHLTTHSASMLLRLKLDSSLDRCQLGVGDTLADHFEAPFDDEI